MTMTNINTVSRKLTRLASAERKLDAFIRILTGADASERWADTMLAPAKARPRRSFAADARHFHGEG